MIRKNITGWFIVSLALILTMCLFIGCSSPALSLPTNTSTTITQTTSATTKVTTTSSATSKIIRLSQSIIDAGIADCKDKPTWGIDLPVMHINYLVGVILEAVIILHNGNDIERLVRIDCSPMFETITDSETGVIYQPSPPLIKLWLVPQVTTVRLGLMETKVIKVTLSVPSSVKLTGHWVAGVTADGLPIEQYTQKLKVTSQDIVDPNTGVVTPDTTLTFQLHTPLLEGIQSILAITSTIDEVPQVKSYDAEKGTLTLENLKSNAEREINITYEKMPAQAIAYEQLWLISMLSN